jgi:hypothetical protein
MNKRDEMREQGNKYQKTVRTFDDIGVKCISSNCQINNGTTVWQLPFKDAYGHSIEFATYSSGYVRKLVTYNTRGAKCYQINQTRQVKDKFFKITYGTHKGLYIKSDAVERVLIPNHGDRIEYLLKFILRNYFTAKPRIQYCGNHS